MGDPKSSGGRRPGRRFGWEVNGRLGALEYTFEPDGDGTLLTEWWEFLPKGIAGFRERFGAAAEQEIAKRRDAARSGIPLLSPRSRGCGSFVASFRG